VSSDDQRAFGHDCAYEDIRGQMEPCVSIEDARRRIAWMYAGDNVSAEDIEACAQGYLAGWSSALPAAKPVAPPWGTLPTAAEVEAHVARSAPARPRSGAPWARRYADSSGDGVAIVYLRTEGCAILWRESFGGVWRPMLAIHRASQWRPVDDDGVAVERAR
jgi:hypothetical protein